MLKARKQFAQYLHRCYGDRSTPKHYLNDLDLFVRQVGDKSPESVTSKDVDDFIDAQMEKQLKPATINRRLASLHTFFEYLASEEPDKAWPNPVNRRRHCLKQGQSLPRDASEAEVNALFAVIDDARDRAMLGLMVGVGLRVGEVVTLSCDHLEAAPVPGQMARLRVVGKGRKERIVWITRYWYETVSHWLAVRAPAKTNALFLNQHQQPLSVAGVQYRLKRYCKQAGIHLTCHQLRHTFARRLAEQRMPTESIGQLLGHAQLKTTQLYTAGANPDLGDEFLETMNRLETAPPLETTPVPPLLLPPRQEERANPQALEQAITRLQTLPNWLQETLAAYLRHRWQRWQAHRAAANVATLSYQLAAIWLWLVAEQNMTAWETVQRSDVEAWLNARAAAGIKVNTRRTQLTTLFGCLRFASDQGLVIATNIFRIPYPARPDPLPRYLPADEYQRLLKTVQEQTASDSPRHALDRAWFLTLAHTGIRSCELLNLRLHDVDFASKRLIVRGSKNYCDRIVFLTPTLMAALAHYLALRPSVEDDHFWLDGDKVLTSARVGYRVHRWGLAAQVAVSPHRLRHTLATQLVNQGMPLPSVGKLLGHRSLNTTQHYARLFEQTVKEQFEAAIAHIEGIAAISWPQARGEPGRTISQKEPEFVEHIIDSV
jgi:site-specific recombinase XerD